MTQLPPSPQLLDDEHRPGLDALPCNAFVWYIDRQDLGNSVLLYANRAARKSDPLMEHVGQRAKDAFPLALETEQNAFLYSKQALESAQPRRLVDVVYGDDERGQTARHYESKIFPLDANHVLVLFDIIDNKAVISRNDRLFEEVMQRNAELERSNAELERFAYVASHDLQEPLRTISTFLDMLVSEHRDNLPAEAQGWIARVVDASMRQRNMIRALLTYSGMLSAKGSTDDVDLSNLVQEVLDDLSPQIRDHDANIEVDSLPTVRGNRDQLSQLFRNLVSNALKFHEPGSQPVVRIAASTNDPEAETFRIEDNGIGVPQQHRGEVFLPFRRLHPRSKYSGSGIGLAICARVAELHGGHIEIDESETGGAAVRVWLPSAA